MIRKSFPLALALGLALAACSADPVDDALVEGEKIVPAETARLLSLGGHLIGDDKTAFELSQSCATSLRVTAGAMQALAGQANAAEIAMVDRAAELYTARAVASSEGPSERQIRAAIARDAEQLKGERSEQAQLAIVCLRSLG